MVCTRAHLTLTLLCCAVLMSQPAVADDWPQWRGPQRTGISQESGWATTWPEGGPEQLWKVNVGTGFSSVAVVDGRVFTMGHRDGRDTIYCLDAGTGESLWQHSYACQLVDRLHEGGPAATPTVHAGRVYTYSKEGEIFCLRADSGEVIWSKHLRDSHGAQMPEWGFSSSPLVIEGMVIVDAGRVVALNAETGADVWATEPFSAGYGTAAPFENQGRSLLAVLNNEALLVVSRDDGRIVARHPWETPHATSSTTPIISGDTIFISTGYKRGCALLQLVGDALSPVYENDEMSNHMANCVLVDGYLYGVDGNSHNQRLCKLTCMEHATGEVKWIERGLGCGSLMVADGELIVLGDSGTLQVAPLSTEQYLPTASAEVLSGRCWTVPVLANGRIYCRNAEGDLVCVDVSGQ